MQKIINYAKVYLFLNKRNTLQMLGHLLIMDVQFTRFSIERCDIL